MKWNWCCVFLQDVRNQQRSSKLIETWFFSSNNITIVVRISSTNHRWLKVQHLFLLVIVPFSYDFILNVVHLFILSFTFHFHSWSAIFPLLLPSCWCMNFSLMKWNWCVFLFCKMLEIQRFCERLSKPVSYTFWVNDIVFFISWIRHISW